MLCRMNEIFLLEEVYKPAFGFSLVTSTFVILILLVRVQSKLLSQRDLEKPNGFISIEVRLIALSSSRLPFLFGQRCLFQRSPLSSSWKNFTNEGMREHLPNHFKLPQKWHILPFYGPELNHTATPRGGGSLRNSILVEERENRCLGTINSAPTNNLVLLSLVTSSHLMGSSC